jgi:hypothetical protein
MKSRLQGKTDFGDVFENRGFNVYDVETKEKVFSGGIAATCSFLGLHRSTNLSRYVRLKSRRTFNGKKYAIRFASTK